MASAAADTLDQTPQWSYQETRDFVSIRAQLETNFTQTKRNKALWEFIAARMREKGYHRSAEQCKCKWKNLAIGYKVTETSNPESVRQCPFFEELRAVFAAQRDGHFLAEMAEKNQKNKSRASESSYEEESDGERGMKKKRRPSEGERFRATAERSRANSMQEALEDFFRQQHDLEVQWSQSVERRERERRVREEEWRQGMESLQRERAVMEGRWWEKEQQRRDREAARSEKRDALLSTLVAKLIRQDSEP